MNNLFFKTFGSTLIVGAFLFLAFGSDESKTDQKSNNTVDCSSDKGAYTSGYSSGSAFGGDCESFVQKYNYETGRNILVASECYCEGFKDGNDGKSEKYSSDAEVSNMNSDNDYLSSNEAGSESSNSTYNNSELTNYQEEGQNSNYVDEENETENELEENYSSNTNYEENNFNGFPFVKTPIRINPNPINGSQNVFFNKNYTLFDQTKINEPIFPVNKNGIIVYQIYYSSNEDPRPYYSEFTPEQLEKHLYYKFKNKANCMVFCNSKNKL